MLDRLYGVAMLSIGLDRSLNIGFLYGLITGASNHGMGGTA